MTTALITGISGMVGSHLSEYLLDHTDWDIVGMIRWRSPLDNIRRLVSEANQGGRVKFVYADLRDTLSIQSVVREASPDYVFHLAAQSYPLTSFTSPLDTLDTNVQGTVRLLEAIREFAPQAWIHNCSSSEVYGRVTRDKLPIKEDCPFASASPYAISKASADMAGRFYAEAYDLRVLTTRMFTHTGPRRGDVFAESSFAKQIEMINAGLMNPPIKVGNLASLRTVADVRDAVRAYHMLLTVNPVPGAVYNIGGNHVCTIGDILEALFRLSGIRYPVETDPSRLRPLDADLQVPDCSAFKAATGWEPAIPFDETMAGLLSYWREKVRNGPCLQR